MKTLWFKDCTTEEERDAVRHAVKNSPALDILRSILADQLVELERKETLPDYTSPAWSHKVAHNFGDKYRLRQTLELLNIEKE